MEENDADDDDDEEEDVLKRSHLSAYNPNQGNRYQHGWQPNWANLPSKEEAKKSKKAGRPKREKSPPVIPEQRRLAENEKARKKYREKQAEKKSRPETPEERTARLLRNEKQRNRRAKKRPPKVFRDEIMPDDIDPAERSRLLENKAKRIRYHAKKPTSGENGKETEPLDEVEPGVVENDGLGYEAGGDVPGEGNKPALVNAGTATVKDASVPGRFPASGMALFTGVRDAMTAYLKSAREPAVAGFRPFWGTGIMRSRIRRIR